MGSALKKRLKADAKKAKKLAKAKGESRRGQRRPADLGGFHLGLGSFLAFFTSALSRFLRGPPMREV